MLKKFIRSCLLFILIGGGIMLYNKPEIRETIVAHSRSFTAKLPTELPNVQGINTKKAEDISTQIKSDVNDTVNQAQKQALDLKVSDLLNFLNRSQKIATDFKSFQDYVKQQIEEKIANLEKNKL